MVYAFSLGGGLIETSENGPWGHAGKGSGWGFAGSVLLARELFPGVALGGLVSFQELSQLRKDLWETENSVTLGFLGPAVEGVVCWGHCLRVGGALGLALVSSPDLSDVDASITKYAGRIEDAFIPADANHLSTSLGYELHLAYDLTVAPTWFAGLGARFIGSKMSSEKTITGYGLVVDLLKR
jgi:hypothetical protein